MRMRFTLRQSQPSERRYCLLFCLFVAFAVCHRPRVLAVVAYTILYHTILYYPILSYPILSYTILDHTILSYPILYYTILYYTIPSYTAPLPNPASMCQIRPPTVLFNTVNLFCDTKALIEVSNRIRPTSELYYTILYYTYTILYYTIPYHNMKLYIYMYRIILF